MTQDTKTALELLARCKRLHAAVNKTEEETRGFDSLDAAKSIRYELIYADVSKSVSAGEELRVFCKGKLSIKQDMQEEIRKIDAEIRVEGNKFDRENKAKLDKLNETIRNEGKKHGRWDTTDTIVRILCRLAAIAWVVFYFVVMFSDPHSGPLVSFRKFFNSDLMVILLILPPLLCLGLGGLIGLIFDHFSDPAVSAMTAAKKEIESIQKERAELIASIEKKKEDYLEILELV